jgi:hypothetical protein
MERSVFLWVEFLRFVQICVFTWQLLSKKSVYRKNTIHGRSFMEIDNKYL